MIILGVRNFRVFEILEHLPYVFFESDTVKNDCPVQIFRKMIKYLKI